MDGGPLLGRRSSLIVLGLTCIRMRLVCRFSVYFYVIGESKTYPNLFTRVAPFCAPFPFSQLSVLHRDERKSLGCELTRNKRLRGREGNEQVNFFCPKVVTP